MEKAERERLKKLAEKANDGSWRFESVEENEANMVAFLNVASPTAILSLFADYERLEKDLALAHERIKGLETDVPYLEDWADIDIAASKAMLAFEEELAHIIGIDPDEPEKIRRAEILAKVATLEKEADWLAAAQNWDVPAEEPTRCPEGKTPPNGCIGVHDCAKCWYEAACNAVEQEK